MSDWLKKVRIENPAPEPVKPESQEPVTMANLTIKVPRSDRDHWVGSARLEGTNLTRVVVEFLEERYGRG